jgi:hypothetical protein
LTDASWQRLATSGGVVRTLKILLLALSLIVLPGCSKQSEEREAPDDAASEAEVSNSPDQPAPEAVTPAPSEARTIAVKDVEIDGKPLAHWLNALSSADGAKVSDAAQALLSHSEAGAPALCAKLATLDQGPRNAVLTVMQSADAAAHPAIAEGLRPILADLGKDRMLRMLCISTIAKCGAAAAVAHAELAQQLRDETSSPYDAAILTGLKAAGVKATESVLKTWPDASPLLRKRILKVLESLPDSPAVLPILFEVAKSDFPEDAIPLFRTRASLDGVVEAVIPCLEKPTLMHAAMGILGAAGEKAKDPVLKYLAESVKEGPPASKIPAIVELSKLMASLKEKQALLPLLQLSVAVIGREVRHERSMFEFSIEAIGGPFPEPCHEALRQAIKPRDATAQRLVNFAIASGDPLSQDLLFSLLRDERGCYQDHKVALVDIETFAVNMISTLKPLPVERLITALDSEDRLTRFMAAQALMRARVEGKAAIKALTKRLDDHIFIRDQAIEALGAMGHAAAEEGAPALVKAIIAKELLGAGRHLGWMGHKAVPAIREGFKALIKSENVSGLASSELVSALISIGHMWSEPAMPELALFVDPVQLRQLRLSIPEVVAELVKLVEGRLKSKVEPGVRSLALKRLAAYGPAASSAIPALEGMLKKTKGSPGLQSALTETIRKIRGR